MPDRLPTSARFGRFVAAFSVSAALLTVVIGGARGGWSLMVVGFVLHHVVLAVGLGSLSWVTMKSQPGNGFVWTITWSALLASLFSLGFGAFWLSAPAEIRQLSDQSLLLLSPSDLPLSTAILFLPTSLWVPATFLMLGPALLLFPDGRPPSRAWRWALRYGVASIAVESILFVWLGRPSSGASFGNPFSEGVGVARLAESLFILPVLAVVLSVAALVVRYRQSRAETRQQIKWIAWGGVFSTLVVVVSTVTEGVISSGASPSGYAVLGAEVLLIASLAFAITKYRLYDIDLVINKTVVYGLLAAFIGTVYVGIVVGIGSLLGQQASFGLSIVATALVAVAFQPVRRRVERWADRLIYGERASPYEVLASFSRRAADTDESELVDRIPRLIVDGTAASEARLWTISDGRFVASATWPPTEDRAELEAVGSRFDDPSGDVSVPIFHDGELLGGISMVRGRGETFTPGEEELVRNLASGLGLALHNAGLTMRLRREVADLEASRERILAAADGARRALELDLDSGPLQRLVALKVKLGPTRLMAERQGAERTAKVLGQLERDSGDALRAVREFASGIYPPLLEAEGLAAALTHETERAPFPVILHVAGVGRYPREIEAAVYFSVLEAVQNAVKYSKTDSVVVTLEDDGSAVTFDVTDHGEGFDVSGTHAGAGLANMADRMDAVGGEIDISSNVGEGTRVRARIPLPDRTSVARG